MSKENVPDKVETPEVKTVTEKVIEKVPDKVPEPVIQPVAPIEPKPKRQYTKDPNRKYGNITALNKFRKTHTVVETKPKERKVQVLDNTNLPKNKASHGAGFYVGIGIGLFLGGVGLYFVIKKIREHIQSNKEVAALKELADIAAKEAMLKPENQNQAFLTQ